MRIALFGNGFIGSELYKHLPITDLITRDNYESYRGYHFDIFINATGNNRGYEVNRFPQVDCEQNVCTTYNTMFDFKIDKYIYISSIAVYDQNSNYGFNKLLNELIVKKYMEKCIILRCSAIIDKASTMGLIADIKNGTPLFVTPNSLYQFITRTAVVDIIKQITEHWNYTNFDKIYNVGGIGSIKLSEIEEMTPIQVKYAENCTYRNYCMNVESTAKEFGLKTTKEYVEEIL